MYLVMSLVFGGLAALWIFHLRRNRERINKLHHAMTALVLLKAVALLFEAVRYHSIRTLGHPTGWSIVYYIVNFTRGMLFFTVILLIGMGWSMVKPFLNTRERRIMLVVLPLQVLVNVGIIVADEASPGSILSSVWKQLFHLLDVVCCFLVLLPIGWSMRQLRTAAAADGRAQKTLDRLSRFQGFYLYTVAYIYATRILLFLLSETLSYQHTWVAAFLSEVATAAYYTGTGWRFRPTSDNPYARVAVDESDDEGVIEEDEFGLQGKAQLGTIQRAYVGKKCRRSHLPPGATSMYPQLRPMPLLPTC